MKKIMFNDRYGLTDAVLNGTKTQTRRLMNPQPQNCSWRHKQYKDADWKNEDMHLIVDSGNVYCEFCGYGYELFCDKSIFKLPYKVGETVAVAQSYKELFNEDCERAKIGEQIRNIPIKNVCDCVGWNNKMFTCAGLMPHQIRITGVRIERLKDISDEDCIKEGITFISNIEKYYFENPKKEEGFYFNTPREAYAALIDKVSGRGTWDSNPYVFVYDFELVK